MGFKTITGVHWTNLELEGLLEDEDSCVHLEKVKKHLGLHPFHLTDLNAALREILNASLNSFDAELNGLVLAYKNPKLLSPLGDILYDTCYVHVDVEADFYIFRPEVGRSLKGFVNKQGTNHIGILLHKAFNVSVPKPDDEEDWPGDKVKVGQEVRFTPEEIDYKTRLPYIRGSMREEEYLNGCQLFNEEIAAIFESEFQEITRWNHKGESLDFKKKISLKAENKHVVFDSDSEVEVNPDDAEKKPSVKQLKIKSDDAKEPKSPSKKRKRKSTLTSESEAESTQQNNKEPKNSTSEVPKNPLKKRKKNLVINDQSPNETEDEKLQKPSINELSQRQILNSSSDADSSVPNSPKKKHKKSKKNKIDNETEDERNHKSTIKNLVNQSLDDSADEETNEHSPKKSKKRQKKSEECVDTEDERQYKSTINKTLTQKSIMDDADEAESESESPITQSRKRKKSFVDDIPNDTEDERNYKLSLKKLSKELTANNSEAEFEVPRNPPKKRKKKTSSSESNDLLKKAIVDDDTTMDTEDERRYKSSLKPLIQIVEQNNLEDGSEFKVPKKKKHKKKRTSSSSETETSFDPLSIKVKAEPESETEEVRAMKRKRKKAKRDASGDNDNTTEPKENGTEESLMKDNIESYVEDSPKTVKVKKLKHSQENDADSDSGVEAGKLEPALKSEEQETRKKVKKEKHNKESSK